MSETVHLLTITRLVREGKTETVSIPAGAPLDHVPTT